MAKSQYCSDVPTSQQPTATGFLERLQILEGSVPGDPRPGAALPGTLEYEGSRIVRQTTKVGTTWKGVSVVESTSQTVRESDRYGRLIRVTEPSGPLGADVTTTYDYDMANRLARVETAGADLGRVASLTYPRCTAGFAKCNTDTGGGWRTVTHTYDRGYLTAIPGYAFDFARDGRFSDYFLIRSEVDVGARLFVGAPVVFAALSGRWWRYRWQPP